MNLIEVFEKKPFQDVGTFNAVFKTTPLLGFSSELEVEIKDLVNGRRRLLVGEQEVFLDLTQTKLSRAFAEKETMPVLKEAKKKLFVKKQGIQLPEILRKLSPSEFMIYHALKEMGEVNGILELSRNISLTSKSIYNNLPRLVKLGLVKTSNVNSDKGNFLKISVDTTSN